MMKTKTSELQVAPEQKIFRVAILTKCCDDWGGSEELWARSVPHLHAAGVEIMLLKDRINQQHPRIAQLAANGVQLFELRQASITERILKKVQHGMVSGPTVNWEHLNFQKQLELYRPHLVVIAQGINFDGLDFAELCLHRQVPYVIICQKAVEFYWPPAHLRQSMRQAFEGAKKVFFVSRQNQQLTEEQFGFRFSNACVMHNPVRFTPKALPFPEQTEPVRLACIGRLFIIDKGQDILLRILSTDKWRSRPVQVSFIGTGPDEEGLQQMARLLDLNNVVFTGPAADMQTVWQTHHALVLPSRSEGAPLVVLEALAMGRPVIAAKAGGTPEYVQEGVNGFLAEANAEDFEAAMERAWQQRHHWKQMGEAAADLIKKQIQGCPEMEFANEITAILHEN